MNAYLTIAHKILLKVGKPLNAQQILREAHLADLVPAHLHGITQHKTLHARISEDIRRFGERSLFYRTDRGVFYLQALRDSATLTPKQRHGIEARPRYRELNNHPVLAVPFNILPKNLEYFDASVIDKFFQASDLRFKRLKDLGEVEAPFWTFVIVKKEDSVLTYRHGRYREDRDGFLNQRSIGFKSLFAEKDKTFLDTNDHGVVVSGLASTLADLGVPPRRFDLESEKSNAAIEFLTVFEGQDFKKEVICVVTYDCPDWLQPLKRRLAINDLSWLSFAHNPNHLDDFDDWSKKILLKIFEQYRSYEGKKVKCG